MTVMVRCPTCTGEFTPKNFGQYRQKFCSRKCIRGANQRDPRVCPTCEIEFIPVRKNQKYCSTLCHYNRNSGQIVQRDDRPYVHIRVPQGTPGRNSNGLMLLHRYVMQGYLGRPLRDYETVHHIDGDPLNNDITNLQLRIGKHGRGALLACADCGSQNLVALPLASVTQS